MEQLQAEKLEEFQETIVQGHRYGLDVPDELKAIVKTHFSQLDVDNKMSRREKHKALMKLKKDSDQRFFEETGIRNEAEDYDMDKLINKYNYDQEKMRL